MKKKQLQILVIAVASIFLSACFLQTSSTTVSGRVTKSGEEPVAGAEVSFGGAGLEEATITDADGKFTVTARHKPLQMLRLVVKKKGFAMDETVEFPGFAAPGEPIEIKLLKTVRY